MTEEKPLVTIGAKGQVLDFLVLDEMQGKPGEQGEVWRAHLKDYEKVQYAVKISKKAITDTDDAAYLQFRDEFDALASLSHPNIVRVYYTGIHSTDAHKYPFYVMEFLDPVFPMAKVIEKVPSQSRMCVYLNALLDATAALSSVHQDATRDHGDVKASNILIQYAAPSTVVTRLIDFGFSKLMPPAVPDAGLRGGRPRNLSSLHRPRPAKTTAHADVWQLATTFKWLFLEERVDSMSFNQLRGSHDTASWPIDYADIHRIMELLGKWSSDEPSSLPECGETEEFFAAMASFRFSSRVRELDPDVRNAMRYFAIDEIATAAHAKRTFEAIRIPPRQLILYTRRIKELITTKEFGALRYSRQLGFAHLVYPGAKGTRFEHSLGVYGLACRVLMRLSGHPAFRRVCSSQDEALQFLIMALVHDIGHFPFAHQLEEFSQGDFSENVWARIKMLVGGHKTRGAWLVFALRRKLRKLFGFSGKDILSMIMLLSGEKAERRELSAGQRFLGTLLDGPVDLDKLDYIERDAHHCGVPYGHYLDIDRLIETMRVVERPGKMVSARLGFDRRGLGCLEQVATARHQLYAYVYWHRTVRSATAMFKHVFALLASISTRQELESVFYGVHSDDAVLDALLALAREKLERLGQHAETDADIEQRLHAIIHLLTCVSGRERVLYKAFVERDGEDDVRTKCGGFSYATQRTVAGRVYEKLAEGRVLSEEAAKLGVHNVLIDCRTDKVVMYQNVLIVDAFGRRSRLGKEVPSIEGLADSFRKGACKVRVFVNPLALKEEYRDTACRRPVERLICECLGLEEADDDDEDA